jgi:Uncharacterized protein predicted to be involved in DNA repair (RAMP superfamily)
LKVEFKVKLRNLSSLTVGGGDIFGAADVPMNVFDLPASSVKGAMRTAISKFTPQGYTSCGEVRPDKLDVGDPCDVCRLFGRTGHWGDSCFTVTQVKTEEGERKELLARVRIDRRSWKASKGGLFTQEVFGPKSEFTFLITYHCDDRRLLKLLLYSISALRYWRLGRNAMIDLRIEDADSLCREICGDDQEMRELITSLGDFIWSLESLEGAERGERD